MAKTDIKARVGEYVERSAAGVSYRAYIPKPLPPSPALNMERLYPALDAASHALGRLDGMSMILPDVSLFLYMYVRKEAVLSSQIEGTQSSLSDLLIFESDAVPGVPLDDVSEVSSYVSAMDYGLARLPDFPLSLRLLREIHEILMNNARGGNKMPGEFRTSQNWIGGASPDKAVFVPPPPEMLTECLGSLEAFFHAVEPKYPTLIRAALAHVQFETIHPFLDGNGRLGRLLITFMLCAEGLLQQPLLYLSLYLKTNRQTYYDLLQSVRENGAFEDWIEFFLAGVAETANQAATTAQSTLALFKRDQEAIHASGSSAAAVLAVHSFLQRHPVANTTKIREACGLSPPTVLRSLSTLEDLGIVREISGKERYRIYAYSEYVQILNEGTEPLER